MNRDALNEWVVRKMNARNLSMRRLAKEAGFKSHSEISQTLNDKTPKGLDFYIRLAEVFGEDTIPEMLEVAGVIPTEEGLRSSLLEQVKAVMRLSPEQQQQFIDYGRFLVQQNKQRNEGGESNDLAADSG